uniref:Beta-microseminoprotein n=1 Tax=Sphaeramia orbicularis TaxID=375764 RepID=A0A673BX44_9TELE
QKYSILALLLCALAASAHASCYQKLAKPGMTHCVDDADGTIHEVGSSWRNSKCMDCTCSECCTGYATPRDFPEDCVSVFDPVACEYIVHKKDDNNTLCDIYSAVGK